MNYSPLISVLLPLFDEPLFVAQEAIESICHQSYSNLEILLLLDKPDNFEMKKLLFSIADNDARIKVIINETNIGLPQTLNKGIDLAQGDYIARMDGDDISLPNRIEKQLALLIRHPEIDLLGCDAFIINECGKTIGVYSKLRTNFSNRLFLRKCSSSMIHPTWIGGIDIFRKCKYRNFLRGQDYDFLLRAYALGFQFYNLKETLLKYRIPQESLRSISCKYAYEQYINTQLIKAQFNEYRKSKIYPDLPNFEYDLSDKVKYLSVVPLLNRLRETIYTRNYLQFIFLFYKIMRADFRPLLLRLKSYAYIHILFLLEYFIKKKC